MRTAGIRLEVEQGLFQQRGREDKRPAGRTQFVGQKAGRDAIDGRLMSVGGEDEAGEVGQIQDEKRRSTPQVSELVEKKQR